MFNFETPKFLILVGGVTNKNCTTKKLFNFETPQLNIILEIFHKPANGLSKCL
jgi:hypothetical protein